MNPHEALALLRERMEVSRRHGYGVPWHDVERLLACADVLADLEFEGRIEGLGDATAETLDPTGVLSRARVALEGLAVQ